MYFNVNDLDRDILLRSPHAIIRGDSDEHLDICVGEDSLAALNRKRCVMECKSIGLAAVRDGFT